MKKITLLLILLTMSFGYSQTLPLDFSDPGQAFTWDSANPDPNLGAATINVTTEKLELFGNAGAWDNAFIDFTGGDVVDLSMELNNTISFTMDPLSTLPEMEVRTHRIRLTTSAGTHEVPFTTTGDAEQTILINPGVLGNMTQLRIFIDAGVDGPNGNYAIDDIQVVADPAPTCTDGIMNGDEEGIDCGGTGGCPDCPGPPDTAATTPARDQADVLSIYSDAYTTPPPSNGTQVFAGATLNGITVESNNTLELITPLAGGGFQNQYFADGAVQPIDLSAFTHIHMDIYFNGTPIEGSIFQVIVQDYSAGGAVNIRDAFDVNGLATDQWHSIDALFTDFVENPTAARTQVSQLIFSQAGPLFGDIYLDNIYFYTEATASVDDNNLAKFKIFPNPTQDSWTVKTETTNITSITVFNVLGKSVLSITPNTKEATINGSSLKTGLYFAQVKTAQGMSSLKLVKR
ncbi:MAG: T9SS type A sorting domain-containing protein [Algibacter sp.]|uniref:T9SS type A sorting domain-containing protein n=1 Tax=Algibacter sp. TaxID=1872428 RepID=UPI002636AE24|nr:T9SS type A sorting domain-containing protein [Algibacter sp.]MDG1730500.1 T9SS type A sorting domain-containing protein [Algibacter sp.]MDG2179722.1 T9SS type A sorting domain-containing protein [Algibacter sp.]